MSITLTLPRRYSIAGCRTSLPTRLRIKISTPASGTRPLKKRNPLRFRKTIVATGRFSTENLDARGYLDSEEFDVGFVWRDESDGRRSDRLLAINQRGGERPDGASSEIAYQFARPSSFHVGGVNVVYCDGSTQFLPEDIDYVLFALLMSCDDQDVRTAGSKQPVSTLYRREKKISDPKPKSK